MNAWRERTGPPHRLGDVLGIASLTAAEQPLDEATGVHLVLAPAEEGGEVVEEVIELGLQRQQLLLVHRGTQRDEE
jgi:hypothetical protein